uniref:Uncharacterized protein n=1 Tax=Anguilla anguilla TaxID=7936 RepID=A0A0E9XTZ3_ANGAN
MVYMYCVKYGRWSPVSLCFCTHSDGIPCNYANKVGYANVNVN